MWQDVCCWKPKIFTAWPLLESFVFPYNSNKRTKTPKLLRSFMIASRQPLNFLSHLSPRSLPPPNPVQPLDRARRLMLFCSLVQECSRQTLTHLSSFIYRLRTAKDLSYLYLRIWPFEPECCVHPSPSQFATGSLSASSPGSSLRAGHVFVAQHEAQQTVTCNQYRLYFFCCICDHRWVHVIPTNLSFFIIKWSLNPMTLKPSPLWSGIILREIDFKTEWENKVSSESPQRISKISAISELTW